MRNLLLTGVALAALSAFAAASAARADDQPAAVFPVTSETDLAGWNGPSLNGAAPGSVQVNLGGRTFSALYFQNVFQKDTPSWAKAPQPQFMYYFFLYPGFDYASPSGVHFGAQAEIRVTSSDQPGLGTSFTPPEPWFHEAYTYVASPVFGKVQFGIPNGALVANAVGTADDFGSGVFFSWYNTGMPWVMADAPDNYLATQKIVYTTPTFAGLTAAVSFQPTDVSMNYSDALTQDQDPACGTTATPADPLGSCGLNEKNRVETAIKYAGTFGAVGVKANGGYVFSQVEKGGDAAGAPTTVGQNVSYGNVGAELTLAGFELEGSVSTGKFNVAINGIGNPDGPLPLGAKGSTAYVAALGYAAGPVKVGAVYYHVTYDGADLGGPLGATGRISAEGLGASYTVGPGVVVYLDATTGSIDEANYTGTAYGKTHPSGIGVSTYFTW